jgi:transposase
MESVKYVGLDVHQGTISVAVLNGEGKLVMQSVIATNAVAVLDFVRGLRGTIQLAFEEGTYSTWLYDVLVRCVARLVVCNPRKIALLKSGNKSDRIDARKLAELLRAGLLSPVYHGERSTQAMQQLVASYAGLTQDTGRTMRRIKALYRSRAISCAGKRVYGKRHRQQWLEQLRESGMRQRAEWLYEELDWVQELRRKARHAVVEEGRKHAAVKLLRTVPFVGPLRAAVLVARVQTPHRFRTKRQFWTYCGLGLETRSSADYVIEDGQVVRRKKPVFIRGLNLDHNHELKDLFKSAATTASAMEGPFREFYEERIARGMMPAMARLTLARKIAAIALTLWKKGETFQAEYLKPQAA